MGQIDKIKEEQIFGLTSMIKFCEGRIRTWTRQDVPQMVQFWEKQKQEFQKKLSEIEP